MVNLMNTNIGKTLNRARTISNGSIWVKIFNDAQFRNMILDWVRIDQLTNRGVDSDGDIIGFYSEYTELLNPGKVAGTPYTLNDSGDFYKSMFIVVMRDSFIIDADPIKVDENGDVTDLFKKYGDGIVGLTDETRTKLANELAKRYQIETRRILFGD